MGFEVFNFSPLPHPLPPPRKIEEVTRHSNNLYPNINTSLSTPPNNFKQMWNMSTNFSTNLSASDVIRMPELLQLHSKTVDAVLHYFIGDVPKYVPRIGCIIQVYYPEKHFTDRYSLPASSPRSTFVYEVILHIINFDWFRRQIENSEHMCDYIFTCN